MGAHAWETVTVDGGPFGSCDFWHCPVCGVGGGPTMGKRRDAFIPGPAKKVSEDCEEAQAQIRTYILDERIEALRQKWHADTGEHRHYASLLHDTVKWSPDKTNLMPVLDLIYNIETPVLTDNIRMPLKEVRRSLVGAGFNVTPPHLAQAVVEMAEVLKDDERGGVV
jgi:hypothetical protein